MFYSLKQPGMFYAGVDQVNPFVAIEGNTIQGLQVGTCAWPSYSYRMRIPISYSPYEGGGRMNGYFIITTDRGVFLNFSIRDSDGGYHYYTANFSDADNPIMEVDAKDDFSQVKGTILGKLEVGIGSNDPLETLTIGKASGYLNPDDYPEIKVTYGSDSYVIQICNRGYPDSEGTYFTFYNVTWPITTAGYFELSQGLIDLSNSLEVDLNEAVQEVRDEVTAINTTVRSRYVSR